MMWNWQLRDWPEFIRDRQKLAAREARFLEQAGLLIGTSRHISDEDRIELGISVMSLEAIDTSQIEGETLDRASVQSSIQRALGLSSAPTFARPAESGIADMMVDLLQTTGEPLSDEMLHRWHRKMLTGRTDLKSPGGYREHHEPMQIISGASYVPKVHYEAPPSSSVPGHMAAFIAWFNQTAPTGEAPLLPIERAGLAHLWFECIHPYKDGNGRIGRAISEKALAQGRQRPVFTSLAGALLRHRKDYYRELELARSTLNADRWLSWFADIALEAQDRSLRQVEFMLAKTRLFDRLAGQLNPRQEKALLRLFAEGIDGFRGGLSAKNYMTITGAPTATATRDLVDMVSKGALIREGELKSTRYFLKLA